MNLPTHATTYQLSREEVSGQHGAVHRDQALRCLGAAGIPAAVDTDGVVRGVLSIDPKRFKTLPGAPIGPRQAFEMRVPGTMRFADPSPLSQLGDLPFLESPSLPRLIEKLIRTWSQRVQLIEAAVLAARRLAPNAQLFGDPWRIEGEVSFGNQMVRMMFSTQGDRACVCAIDGCPVDRAPVPRKILPVDADLPQPAWEYMLAGAIAQAKPCLGPPVVTREERQLSIDLASRDLEFGSSAEPPPTLPVPVPTMITPPPRLPPPRKPRSKLEGKSGSVVLSKPTTGSTPLRVPTSARHPAPQGPATLPRPHLASNPRSILVKDEDVLLSVDVSIEDDL